MLVIYLYVKSNGSSTEISPENNGGERNMARLIASEGKAVTDGVTVAGVIDVPVCEIENWTETDEPQDGR